MSTLFYERNLSPFDLLFKDFFKSDLHFQPATEAKHSHPVDILETKDGLHFEIACTGLEKKDIEINIEGDVLRVTYNKSEGDLPEGTWIHRGIARRSFNLGYKIASKFSLAKATAEMENGLLTIEIPFAEEAKPKVLKIK